MNNKDKPYKEGKEAIEDLRRLTPEELEDERLTVDPVRIILHLRQRMDERGITQMELSEKSGVRQASISQLSRGNIERLHIPSLEKIAWALGIEDITQLITFELESEIMSPSNPFSIKFPQR